MFRSSTRVLFLLALVAMLNAGCSSFHKNWDRATAQPVPAGGLAGPWEGRWLSGKNQHTGRLRCIMTQTGENEYDAQFHATFWKVFRASYRVPFKARKTGDESYSFQGESNLGKLAGGRYTYEGTVQGTNFNATYRSKYDHGTFDMSRP